MEAGKIIQRAAPAAGFENVALQITPNDNYYRQNFGRAGNGRGSTNYEAVKDWEYIRDLWMITRLYKFKCSNVPPDAKQNISDMIDAFHQYNPRAHLRKSACEIARAVTIIGRALAAKGLIEQKLLHRL